MLIKSRKNLNKHAWDRSGGVALKNTHEILWFFRFCILMQLRFNQNSIKNEKNNDKKQSWKHWVLIFIANTFGGVESWVEKILDSAKEFIHEIWTFVWWIRRRKKKFLLSDRKLLYGIRTLIYFKIVNVSTSSDLLITLNNRPT